MLVQPKKDTGTLALLDPELPGAKQLPSGEWAINRAAALLNSPTQGLKVQIPVWSSKDLADKVELLLNNLVVDHQTVTQDAEKTQRTTLFVAPGVFQSGTWDLAYRVTRYGQAPEPFTPPLKLKVKLEIPAGQDTDPGQGHSNLHMEFRPPEIVQDGVDKDTAEKGVDVLVVAKPGSGSNLPYPDIAVGDVSWVSWGGKRVPSDPVTQEQIDDPLKNPIIIHISKDVILAAGDSEKEGLAVSFFVRDFADNDSEDWCKETRIVVDTGNSRLDAPILKQADGNELDVDQLDKEPLLLQVVAESPDDFNQNDTIIMHLQGTTLDGETVQVDVRQTIDKKPPLVVEVLMDNDGARALAKTQGVFFFDLERDGSIIQRSRGHFINIIGEPKRLAAPKVESEVGGALNPDLPNVIVRIPYDPLITPDNAIEIHWSITLADDTVFEPELDWIFPTPQEADDPEGFIVPISGPKYLKPGEGGTLVVSYDVLSEGENGEIVRRPSPPASPLNIGEPRLELVPAILLGEKDGTFEPEDLPDGISEVTCPNPVNNPTLPKDVVHWQLHDAQDKLLFKDDKTLNSLSAGKPVKFPLDAAFVQQHFEAHRGEQLRVRYHIVRDATGKTSYSNPLEFSVGVKLDLKSPMIKQAPNGTSLDPIAAKDELTAVVDYVGMALGDEIIVTWSGAAETPPGGSHTAPKKTVTVLGPQEIPLANSVVAFNLNKSVSVSYTVKRGSQDPQPSDIRSLMVLALTLNLSHTPKILQAANNGEGPELDLSAIATAGKIHAPKFPLIAVGQRVWLRLRGTLSSGDAPYDNPYWKDPSAQTSQGWVDYFYEHNISPTVLNELQQLKHGSTFTLEFKAAFGRSQNEAEAVTFPLRTYTVQAVELVTPAITRIDDSRGEVPPGGSTVDTTVTLTGTAAVGLDIELLDNGVPKGTATAIDGIWTRQVTGLVPGAHRFTAKALYGSNPPSPERTLSVLGVVGTIPVDGSITDLEISPDGGRLYVAMSTKHTLAVIDTASHRIIKAIDVPWPYTVATSRDGARLITANYDASSLSFIDPVSLTLTRTIPAEFGPGDIAFSSDGTRAFMLQGHPALGFDPWGGIITVDANNQTIIQTVRFLPTQPTRFAFTSDGTRAFVTEGAGNVTVFNMVTQTVVKTIRIGPEGSTWSRVAITPDGTRVLACSDDGVAVIDIASLAVTGRISQGSYTTAIAIHPDNRRAYVTTESEDVLVVDIERLSVERTIPFAQSYAIAISPDGTRVFVGSLLAEGTVVMVLAV